MTENRAPTVRPGADELLGSHGVVKCGLWSSRNLWSREGDSREPNCQGTREGFSYGAHLGPGAETCEDGS